MAVGKLTARGRAKLSSLQELTRDVQHVYALTEQFATARSGHTQLSLPLKRAWNKFKLRSMAAGYDQMAQLAGGMAIAAGRSMTLRTKIRILRDGVASIQFQMELEERTIRRDETVTNEDDD